MGIFFFGCVQDLIFDFQHFEYDVSRHFSEWGILNPAWGSQSFSDLWFDAFYCFGKVLSYYLVEYFFCPILSLF